MTEGLNLQYYTNLPTEEILAPYKKMDLVRPVSLIINSCGSTPPLPFIEWGSCPYKVLMTIQVYNSDTLETFCVSIWMTEDNPENLAKSSDVLSILQTGLYFTDWSVK